MAAGLEVDVVVEEELEVLQDAWQPCDPRLVPAIAPARAHTHKQTGRRHVGRDTSA